MRSRQFSNHKSGSSAPTPLPAEARGERLRKREESAGAHQGFAPARPDTQSSGDVPAIRAAIDPELGPALAPLFQIAEAKRHPDPQAALHALRMRMKNALHEESPLQDAQTRRTALRDKVTSTDSVLVPVVRWTLYAAALALLAAALYGIAHLLGQAAPQPLGAAGASAVFAAFSL